MKGKGLANTRQKENDWEKFRFPGPAQSEDPAPDTKNGVTNRLTPAISPGATGVRVFCFCF